MEKLKILKGDKNDLPIELNANNIYVAFSNEENNYSSIFINNKEWVSKEYIDLKIGEIETLLNEL